MKWNTGFPTKPGRYAVVIENPHQPHLGRWEYVATYEEGQWYNIYHAKVLYWLELPEIPSAKLEIALAIVDNGAKL